MPPNSILSQYWESPKTKQLLDEKARYRKAGYGLTRPMDSVFWDDAIKQAIERVKADMIPLRGEIGRGRDLGHTIHNSCLKGEYKAPQPHEYESLFGEYEKFLGFHDRVTSEVIRQFHPPISSEGQPQPRSKSDIEYFKLHHIGDFYRIKQCSGIMRVALDKIKAVSSGIANVEDEELKEKFTHYITNCAVPTLRCYLVFLDSMLTDDIFEEVRREMVQTLYAACFGSSPNTAPLSDQLKGITKIESYLETFKRPQPEAPDESFFGASNWFPWASTGDLMQDEAKTREEVVQYFNDKFEQAKNYNIRLSAEKMVGDKIQIHKDSAIRRKKELKDLQDKIERLEKEKETLNENFKRDASNAQKEAQTLAQELTAKRNAAEGLAQRLKESEDKNKRAIKRIEQLEEAERSWMAINRQLENQVGSEAYQELERQKQALERQKQALRDREDKMEAGAKHLLNVGALFKHVSPEWQQRALLQYVQTRGINKEIRDRLMNSWIEDYCIGEKKKYPHEKDYAIAAGAPIDAHSVADSMQTHDRERDPQHQELAYYVDGPMRRTPDPRVRRSSRSRSQSHDRPPHEAQPPGRTRPPPRRHQAHHR